MYEDVPNLIMLDKSILIELVNENVITVPSRENTLDTYTKQN